MHPRLFHHPHGITAVDTEYVRPGLDASHIIVDSGRAAFVDVGVNDSVPYLLSALQALGLGPEAVDYVFLTHVHLDHAGGAGLLMQALPQARAVLHPRGAPHLIEPEKLIAGTRVVYGEERFQRLYGDIQPIAAGRVHTVQDGERLRLGGRELELIYTPGHALHHYAVVDKAHRSVFTGDTFGISYREFDTAQGAFIIPATTPTHFDPQQMLSSIDRMLSYSPESMYLTHFSRVTDVPRLAIALKAQIEEFVQIARRHAVDQDRYAAIRADISDLWMRLLAQHGCTLPHSRIADLLEMDLDLNTQGLLVWLDRDKRN